MKLLHLLFTFALLSQVALAQNYNLTRLSNLRYNVELNDIWGYQHSNGTEYALVGLTNGVSIVNLSDPAHPVEDLFIPGAQSIWRDLKTWGSYAYVIADEGKDGLLIIDLSNPNNFTYQFWRPELTVNWDTDTLNAAHNLYIDEAGYCYIAGSNISAGETIILDVHTTPQTPIYRGTTLPLNAHDIYAAGDTLWTSDLRNGSFSVYDVSDRTAPSLLAQQMTPFQFTHNAWISDDRNTLFTTDEVANAWVTAYDVSDVNDIKELDRWRPFETEGQGVIPHNVHVWNDYVIISYYTVGVIILDATRPANLGEVARYDTYPLSDESGFLGAWGAYPFLPSRLVLVSDINTGLHVLQPNYQRACWLEGVVTELGTGNPIFDVEVKIKTTAVYTHSDLVGTYKTGIARAGTYEVTFSKAGFFPKKVQVTLQNNQVNIQDVVLERDRSDVTNLKPSGEEIFFAYPNPFEHAVQVDYNFSSVWSTEQQQLIKVYDALGQAVDQIPLDAPKGTTSLGATWSAGTYFLTYKGKAIRVIK